MGIVEYLAARTPYGAEARPVHDRIQELGRELLSAQWAERWHLFDEVGPVPEAGEAPEVIRRLLLAASFHELGLDQMGLANSQGHQGDEHHDRALRLWARAKEYLAACEALL